jgi:hypothetical protein
MAGFAHDVAGGQGILIVTQLQSPNFSIADKTGWAIMKNGDAWFFSVTAEGSISANTVVVSGSGEGLFIYSGTPGTGNLIGSWAQTASTDAYGNPYPAGLQVGNSSDTAQVLITRSAGGQAAEVTFPVPSLSLSNTPNIAGGEVTGGYADLIISGPALSTAGDKDWVQFVLYSNSGSGSEARCEFRYVSSTGSPVVTASYNGTGWTFGLPVTASDGMTVASGLAVTGGTTTDSLTVTLSVTVSGDVSAASTSMSALLAAINALSGAATTTDGLPNGDTTGTSATAGLTNGQISGTSGAQSAGTAHTHGPGSFAVTNGQHSHGPGTYAVTDGQHSHDLPTV